MRAPQQLSVLHSHALSPTRTGRVPPKVPLMPFMDLPPDVVPEQLADGRFRCKQCGAVWYPALDGMLEPTLASLRCPTGCGWKRGTA